MNCKHFKIRTKKGERYYYCKLKRKIITLSHCQECINKEYKQYKSIRKRTYKLAKKEKNRESIIYPYLDKCCICGSIVGIIKHECIYGRNRQNSIKYGLVIPLCIEHHTGEHGIHNNRQLDEYYHKLAQTRWEEKHGNRDDFITIFGKSWL